MCSGCSRIRRDCRTPILRVEYEQPVVQNRSPVFVISGTELYRRVKADGILKEEQQDLYQRSYTSIAKRRFDWLGYHVLLKAFVRPSRNRPKTPVSSDSEA